MAIRRWLPAILIAAGVLATSPGSVLAAFYFVTLSASSGPVGTEVAIRIDASNNVGGLESSRLFLVRQDTFDESERCDNNAGAEVIGEVTWQAGTVEFEDRSYPGFVGEGSFTVPDVPLGTYLIAENVSFVGNSCFSYVSFEVSTGLPDTATATPRSPAVVVMTLAVVTLGLLALLVGGARRALLR